MQHPKNFGLIASYLERKVNVKFGFTSECINYQTSPSVDYEPVKNISINVCLFGFLASVCGGLCPVLLLDQKEPKLQGAGQEKLRQKERKEPGKSNISEDAVCVSHFPPL